LVAEARGEFGNPKEGQHQPLKAVKRKLVKREQTEKIEMSAVVNCRM
jgi:hypothetical protein